MGAPLSEKRWVLTLEILQPFPSTKKNRTLTFFISVFFGLFSFFHPFSCFSTKNFWRTERFFWTKNWIVFSELNEFFCKITRTGFFYVNTSQPVSVMSTVCSNCAARFPSLVATVQPSSQVSHSAEPSVSTGSMVKVVPLCIFLEGEDGSWNWVKPRCRAQAKILFTVYNSTQ